MAVLTGAWMPQTLELTAVLEALEAAPAVMTAPSAVQMTALTAVLKGVPMCPTLGALRSV